MAHRNVNRTAAAPVSRPGEADRPAASVNPTGYLCEAWFDQTPALRVNEDASEAALLAWCCAEVQALCASAHAFNMALEHDDPQALCGDDTFAKVFMHRLAPLERMLEMLATRKQLEWRESSR